MLLPVPLICLSSSFPPHISFSLPPGTKNPNEISDLYSRWGIWIIKCLYFSGLFAPHLFHFGDWGRWFSLGSCLLCEHEDLNSDAQKAVVWVQCVIQHWAAGEWYSRDRQIPEIHWPASLANQWTFGSATNLVSKHKKKWRVIKKHTSR